MKPIHLILLATLFLLATANAATLAVLEITIASSDDEEINLTVDQTKFLTDEFRRQAVRLLPKDYSVPTRDKIISMIPDNAENLSTAMDIGKAIKSDYVTQGSISKLGDLFALTVELYETESGNLLGDFVKESADYKGLLDAIRENAPSLLSRIMPESGSEPPATAYKAGLRLGAQTEEPPSASIPANIAAEPKRGRASFWAAIGLDALGTAAFGLGIYSNGKARDYYKESENLMKDVPKDDYAQYIKKQSEFKSTYKKGQDAETMRNIFYATGGALLLGGLAVHIWF